ncbi:aconitate hydratase [Candidatus Bathyarchaeota archaeon]|nr:aconitate hydratase [Candidatus Bathyarchaeota archaeon]
MSKSIVEKIIKKQLPRDNFVKNDEVEFEVTHTLLQDSTGTMSALQFESFEISNTQVELSVCFIDHNMFQEDYKNMEDHQYLQSFSSKHGLYFSKAGNGICHQVFLERFAKPGKILVGSDSHTPTAGGIGMLAFGAGGLDVAAVMAGEKFSIKMPELIGIKLIGNLTPMVSAKDIALELLRILGVKGGVGKILEFFGPGVKNLSVPERSTITNMCVETGATTSIFPSDIITKRFLYSQNRVNDWIKLTADSNTQYNEIIEINLNELEPLISLPHSPGNVKKVNELKNIPVNQVCIGSCTNSSLRDIKIVSQILKNKKINENLSLVISPGSRQVLQHIIESGELNDIINSGARLLECACGPCIGMGQAPFSGSTSLRTFNRNFKGRSGTNDANVYLVSPETAAASALTGYITDPRSLNIDIKLKMPKKFMVNDNMIVTPLDNRSDIQIFRGQNIKPLPIFRKLNNKFYGKILLKLGDNITTDDILPATAHILPLRSNIPEITKFTFSNIRSTFYNEAIQKNGGFIVAGENYGQGSSREHAAIVLRYLGINVIIAKSFARIHIANLINFGILPLIFRDKDDYDKLKEGNELELNLDNFDELVLVEASGEKYYVKHNLSEHEISIIKAGGKMEFIKNKLRGK